MSNNQDERGNQDDDIRPEYNLAGKQGVRGKYYQRLRDGYTIKIHQEDGTTLVQQVTRPEGSITLDPDVREYFPDSESVNAALRGLIQLIPAKKSKQSRNRRQAEQKST